MATYDFNTSTVSTRSSERTLLSKAFLYMLGLLGITCLVSVGMHYIFDVAKIDSRVYATILTCASITQIVLTVVMMFTSLKSGKITVPAIIYAVCMGILISSFSFLLDWRTLTISFAIAACCFGAMALIGYFAKNASGLAMVGMGLLFGIMMTTLFNCIMIFWISPGAWAVQNIVTSVLLVIAIMCITGYDVWQIKVISQHGENSSNLAFYLAFNLYLDFIIIFIHIIRLVIMLTNDNR